MNLSVFVIIGLLFHTATYPIKLDRVILSSDNNPLYLEFWPVVAKAWKKIVGIQPTLILIAPLETRVDETIGDVIRYEPIPGIPTAFQAQVIRLLAPSLFPKEVSIISDIDMLPLNKTYFVSQIVDIPDDFFVIYRDFNNHYPMCYCAGRGDTFKEIFQVQTISIRQLLQQWYSLRLGWFSDECLLMKYVNEWENYQARCFKLEYLGDVNTAIIKNRIDRTHGFNYSRDLLMKEFYVDAHMPRPYSLYKTKIDGLLNIILSKYSTDHQFTSFK